METMQKNQCSKCSGAMHSVGVHKIQLGKQGLFLGIWNHLFAGALEAEICICTNCNKIEFYLAEK